MKLNANIEVDSIVQMLESEVRSEKHRYFSEVGSQLSQICGSSDALGPLHLKEQIQKNILRFTGAISYSRFRPGDRVEIRTKRINSDYSDKFSYNWVVTNVLYSSPGALEIVVSSNLPVEIDDKREYFLFSSLSANFNKMLIKKIMDMKFDSKRNILGKEIYDLDFKNSQFRAHYRKLNLSQKMAIDYLYDHNLSGAIQGPPGTGKTQLLQAVVSLALHSNMIC